MAGSANDEARTTILAAVRRGLNQAPGHSRLDVLAPSVPAAARIPARVPGSEAEEIALLLAEIEKLGGHTRRISGLAGLNTALAELVAAEEVQAATRWPLPELDVPDLDASLRSLAVRLVPPDAGIHVLAACDLGITGADAALPETGTILLRGGPERPRMVSLVPRVHLVLLRPDALRVDLHAALAEVKDGRYAVFVSGPSRTSDIELTLTIGVHGPKALYVWLLEWMRSTQVNSGADRPASSDKSSFRSEGHHESRQNLSTRDR